MKNAEAIVNLKNQISSVIEEGTGQKVPQVWIQLPSTGEEYSTKSEARTITDSLVQMDFEISPERKHLYANVYYTSLLSPDQSVIVWVRYKHELSTEEECEELRKRLAELECEEC